MPISKFAHRRGWIGLRHKEKRNEMHFCQIVHKHFCGKTYDKGVKCLLNVPVVHLC